jgi:PAS domain S-box-containing protein
MKTTQPEKSDMFRVFFEQSADPILILENGVFTDCNQAAVDMLGAKDKAEVLSSKPSEISPEYQPDGRLSAEREKEFLQIALQQGSHRFDWVHRRLDGEEFTVELTLTAIQIGERQLIYTVWNDITERIQAENARRASEEQFRTLYDNATIGLYRTTPDGRILMINPTGLRLLGFDSFEEMAKRNLEEAGFEQENSRKKFREELESKGVIDQESEWTKKDGSSIFVREGAKVIRDENGEVLYYDGSFEDVTARKQAEANVRYLASFVETANEAIMSVTMQGEIVSWNAAAEQMFGYTKQEIIGKPVGIIAPPEVQEQSGSFLKQLARGENVPQTETVRLTKDGRRIDVLISASPVKDEHGRVTRFSGVMSDMTARKQAQEAVLASEERFRRFTEATVEGLVFHEQGKVVDVNPAAVTMFGFSSSADLIDKNLLDFIVPESHELVLEQMQLESVMPYEIQGIRSDGSIFPVETSTRAYKVGDRIIRASSIRDITERKQLESQIQEAFERRGYQVQVSTEISQEVASASELGDLFNRVVTLTKERLGYYHTQLLRYDAAQDAVVLINGYGEIGQKMLEEGHQLPMGSGLIGTAAANGQTVMRPTLAEDTDWHPNPLLPDTKGEIAVPIKWQDTVLGVLDVQSNQAGALTEDDRLLLEGLCGQIAIAMQSAELVEVVRQNEARLAEALKTARLANWEYDVEKDLFKFNDQFYSIFHTTVEKAGGYQISSARYAELFVHPDDMELVGTEIGKALSSTEKVYNTTLDHRVVYEDGGIGYITVQVTVERDENGKITRYYGANQDITERKQAEEALRHSEQEMAERLEEVNRLYQSMSREGWKTYRDTTDLPTGFMFDQTGLRPVDETALADNLFASIPMKVLGGEVVGTLTVANDPRNPASAEDRAFLEQVSDQIALALEGARLTAQTQSALSQSEKLFEASRVLTQATDLQELTASTVSMLGAQEVNRAVIATFNYDAENNIESLDIIANWWNGTGHEATPVGTHYPLEVIRAMSFFVSPTPVFFNDTLIDERVDAVTLKLVQNLNLRAVAVLPLYTGTHQIGALILEAEDPHNFTQDEIRLFTALAPQISTVLENRRQFERAQQQADRESTLNLISQKIQSATTVEAVLQIAARELGHALGAPMTIAQLSMKDKK